MFHVINRRGEAAHTTKNIDLNRDWEFCPEYSDAFLAGKAVAGLEPAELPHTCRETPFHYFDESVYQMVCGYRRTLPVPADWAGKRVLLCVGAAGHSAEVFVDGQKVGEHRGGYTAFRVDLTDALTPGRDALLVIRVDSRETQDIPPFGHVVDYMTYGGLYREVKLEIRDPEGVEDVFYMPELDPSDNRGVLRAEARLTARLGSEYSLRLTVFPWEQPGLTVAEGEVPISGDSVRIRLDCGTVQPWDIDSPFLYGARTELTLRGETVDTAVTRIGFRRAEFRADGFWLNGRRVKLVGLNRHQSYPYVGYAVPASLQRLDADILKNELGLNAVRTSHYPQSQHFIDRCDELGLLVFTEIPGWQHIGGEEWKELALKSVEEMVLQYRNHPAIVLWGVRINESPDDDELYTRTNALAHRLDSTRPTGGVRYLKKSSFLEDVYTFNDFSHDGTNAGCERKKNVTPDMGRAYLISEYAGHMFPTKTFDSEEHRLEHALRHANILDAAAAQEDIAGSFGWCMFDYNTHRDFGSGDRICYHGVLDMFRNKKPAADVYAVRQDEEPVLSVSSTMDIGEHPAGNRGRIFLFTNADSVQMYQNGEFIREYTHGDSPYKHLFRPPIEVDDFLGERIEKNEGFSPRQAALVKDILNSSARFGSSRLSFRVKCKAAWLMLRYRMTFEDAYRLYGKYIGNWGGASTEYRFEAVKDGKVVRTVVKSAATDRILSVQADHTVLREGASYDAALVRIAITDQNGNVLPFYHGPVSLRTEGPIAVVGPSCATLRGGLGGTIVKTRGSAGNAALILSGEDIPLPVRIEFTVEVEGDGG